MHRFQVLLLQTCLFGFILDTQLCTIEIAYGPLSPNNSSILRAFHKSFQFPRCPSFSICSNRILQFSLYRCGEPLCRQ